MVYDVRVRRAFVVLNPSSFDFEASRRWPSLRPILTRLLEIEVLETSPDDADTERRIREKVAGGFDRVIAIGGDGTVHLTLNALMTAGLPTLPELAVIPFGTANDVAKSLALPVDDPARLAEIAAGTRTGRVDIAHVRVARGGHDVERYWIDAVTIGMDADVLAARGRYRDLGGYLGYVAALAERAVEQQSLDVHLEIDGQPIDTRVFNVLINNVPVYAGELEMPGSRRDDGLLDVYLFNRREYASKVISFAIKQVDVLGLGVHELLEDLTDNQRAWHGRRVKLRLASPRRAQVDGEVFGETDEIECSIAGQLTVAIPGEARGTEEET